MRKIIVLLFCISISNVYGQTCPFVKTAIINACGSQEGLNEWVHFSTGNTALALSDFRFRYGMSPNYNDLIVNGSITGIWQPQPGSLTLTSPPCGFTVITSGSIPANTEVILIPSTTTLTLLNMSTICSSGFIYVIFYDPSLSSGFNVNGNFANAAGAGMLRGFKVFDQAISSCNTTNNNTVYEYESRASNWGGNSDGNSVKFSGTTVSYFRQSCNTVLAAANGSSNVNTSILPTQLSITKANLIGSSFNAEIAVVNTGWYQIQVYDAAGAQLKFFNQYLQKGSNTIKRNDFKFAKGLLILRINNAFESSSLKLIN